MRISHAAKIFIAGILFYGGAFAQISSDSSVDLMNFKPDPQQLAPGEEKKTDRKPSAIAKSAESSESFVDLTTLKQDPLSRASANKAKAATSKSALATYAFSRFQKRFPEEINTMEKLEEAARIFAEKLATENKYFSHCGHFIRSEALKPKFCSLYHHTCQINVASEKCHYVEMHRGCPKGSSAPVSTLHESRGFKVCAVDNPTPSRGGQGTGSVGGSR